MPRAAKRSAKKSGAKSGGKLVKQPHGGAIRRGSLPGNTPGTGRPPDALRAKLRELGLEKGVPLINKTLDGQIAVSLIGKCDACEHEQPFSEEWVELILNRVKVTTDQQLKANEQALKYGLQAKELVIASDTAAAFFDCVHRAIVELAGEPMADQVKARAIQLLEAKA